MKHPGIAIVLGKGLPPAESSGELPEDHDEHDGGDMDEKGHEAADEFLSAVKSGDAGKVWEAFQAMHRCDTALMDHEGDDGEDGYGDEDEEEEK
jgi:hypothetical protein